MIRKTTFSACLLILFYCALSQPGNLVFHNLSKEKRFAQSVCYDIVKDRRGFIWISTNSGLFRYDGTTFIDVTKNNLLLKGHALTDIFEDETGKLWISKFGSEIVKYDPIRESFSVYDLTAKLSEHNIVVAHVSIIYADKNGKILLRCDEENIIRFNSVTEQLDVVYRSKPFYKLQIYHDVKNPDRITLYEKNLKDNNLRKGQVNGNETIQWQEQKKNNLFISGPTMHPDENTIYALSGDGLQLYDWIHNTVEQFLYADKKLVQDNKKKMLLDANGFLWIPASGGLVCFDTKTKTFVNNYINSEDDPYSILPDIEPKFCDNNNILWLTSWGKGICYTNLQGLKFSHVLTRNIADKLQISNFVRALASDNYDNYYASLQNSGFAKFDKYGNFQKMLSPQQGAFPVETIQKDSKGNIWAMGVDMHKYNPVSGKIELKTDFGQELVSGFVEMPNGKFIVYTYSTLFWLDPVSGKSTAIPEIGMGTTYTRMEVFGNGQIFLCQRDYGVDIYEQTGNSWRFIKKIAPKLFVKSICRISNDTALIATTTGLYRYVASSQQLTELTAINEQLSNKYLYSIVKDANGNFWMSSNNGLSRWETSTGHVTNFGTEFGLQDAEFNTNAYCTGSDGNIWFGGVNGINIINRNQLFQFDKIDPNLKIVSVNSDSIYILPDVISNLYEKQEIPAGYNSIDIEYNSIHYFNPEKIKVRYRLLPFEKDWVTDINSGHARFINVPPGEYEFQVMTSDIEGKWLEPATILPVYFHPQWWQTRLFRVSMIVIIIGLLVLAVFLFTRNKLKQQRLMLEKEFAVQRERERIITDLHDDVGATLSSMSIYGDLAGKIWESQPLESRNMMDKISRISKDLMQRMGDIIWSMKQADDEKYNLENKLRNYSNELLVPKNIHCEFLIDEKTAAAIVHPEKRKNILLLIKEALNNIAKYSNASKVCISLQQEKEIILLSISDNGIGIDLSNNGHGNGLSNIANRCSLLGGNFAIDTALGKGVKITCHFDTTIFSDVI